MSFLQFPKKQMYKIVDASGEDLGSFQPTENLDLQYIMLGLYVKGTLAGYEEIRLSLYENTRYSQAVASSDWNRIAEIDGIGTGNWLGYLRFDFNGYTLNSALRYYVKAETAHYTRSGDTFYFGILLDYNPRLYTAGTNLGVYMPIIGGV